MYLIASTVRSLNVPRIDTRGSCFQPPGSKYGLGGISPCRYALCRASVMEEGTITGAYIMGVLTLRSYFQFG
jgi:hypothetical protein